MTTLWTFIPEDTSALIAGTHNVIGFPDESFIRISKDIPITQTRRTTDNRITRVKKTSNMYTIEMSLFSVSPTNEILTKLWQVDELTKNVKFPMLIRNSSNSGFFFAPTCWIEEIPTLSYSSGVEVNTWKFKCHEGVINFGSAEDPSTAQEIINIAASTIPLISEYLNNG